MEPTPAATFLTAFEVARVVGVRSLQLAAGATPLVDVQDPTLRLNTTYVAALELHEAKLDFRVHVFDGMFVRTTDATAHPVLASYLDTVDGADRSAQGVSKSLFA